MNPPLSAVDSMVVSGREFQMIARRQFWRRRFYRLYRFLSSWRPY